MFRALETPLCPTRRACPSRIASCLRWAARRQRAQRRGANRVIIVTFGGGVRYSETFAPEGLRNIPRLVELRPQGLLLPELHQRRRALAFQFHGQHPDGQLAAGGRFRISAAGGPDSFEHYRKQTGAGPMDAWAIATNKSFAAMGCELGPRLRTALRRERRAAEAAAARSRAGRGAQEVRTGGVASRENRPARSSRALERRLRRRRLDDFQGRPQLDQQRSRHADARAGGIHQRAGSADLRATS